MRGADGGDMMLWRGKGDEMEMKRRRKGDVVVADTAAGIVGGFYLSCKDDIIVVSFWAWRSERAWIGVDCRGAVLVLFSFCFILEKGSPSNI